MKLSQLLSSTTYAVHGARDRDIKGIDYDSRRLKEGYLFVALPGRHVDGKSFIPDAIAAGAAAVVVDAYRPEYHVTQIVAPEPLKALAELCAEFYRRPDRKLLLVGVTGTNGKTTITYFLESIFEKTGLSTGVVGTVNYRYANKIYPAPNTTPQSSDVYRLFAEMVRAKRKAAIMEVSSHALALGRVAGMEFDIGVFTNLTRDHLDFHQTMEEYFAAKGSLFAGLRSGDKAFHKYAIINADDPWGKKLAGQLSECAVMTYGIREKTAVRAEHVHLTGKGTEFVLLTPQGRMKVRLPHLGQHNVYNALAAAGAALAAGLSLDQVVQGLEEAPMVPGRLEKIDAGQPFTVVVDFAHTDDALRNVIAALKELKPSRLITVFGCGGDRDRSKRPIMGDAATELSDFVFVTSDNPRSEDPERIALDIEVGIRRQHRNNYQVIVDREQAIASAIAMAHKGDILLIAGKGHETYQIVGDKRFHFNDAEVARKHLLAQHTAERENHATDFGGFGLLPGIDTK